MDTILDDIDLALESAAYYVAIAATLALPDICAALESPNGETSKSRFMAWYDRHLAATYPRLTATDCYSLRCGVLHQGRLGHPKSQYDRVLFMIPNPHQIIVHNAWMRLGDQIALTLDTTIFFRDVVAAVRQWFSAAQNDPIVQANVPKLVALRPSGLAPFVVGMPLIA